ncbi:MAG TPA: hypothetical protein VNW15_06000 [Rhizomicrobium sp.]|jgi:hypothetical protein|nr:hypothetical protein [Rhizomicrobium sp.]
MRSAFIIAVIVLGCSGCAVEAPRPSANGYANYDFQGDITADGGTDCWYRCF